MPAIERKFLATQETRLEVRADDSSSLPKIEGYSALFDSETIISTWWGDSWRETIRMGFFQPAIKNGHDVRALFNHDANFVLGRTTSPKKTLTLREDETGLFASIAPPNNSIGRDVVESIERGDISGQSFAFTIAQEKWVKGDAKKGQLDLRELLLVDTLYDVGPVTYPAFEDTDIAVDRNAAMAVMSTRARGLEQLGEALPSSVMRDFRSIYSDKSKFFVPVSFELESEKQLRSIIAEEVSQLLSDKKDEGTFPVDEVSNPVPAEDSAEEKEIPASSEEPAADKSEDERKARMKSELAKLELLALGN